MITVLHCTETLVIGGCCRVMEHLATGLDAAQYRPLLVAQTADPAYLAYLQAKGLAVHLLRDGKLPLQPGKTIAVLHRAGEASAFWSALIPALREAGVAAILERNIFGYADAHNDRQLDRIFGNSINTLWHHWCASGRPPIAEYLVRHRVLYNALDFQVGAEELAALRQSWRQKLGIAENAVVLGVVTRPDARKIDGLLLGLARHLRTALPHFVLVTRRYPEAMARALYKVLPGRYHNLPVSADPEALKATYAVMDVFGNFPSIGESFGMAMAEAMHCCLPVVALDLVGKHKGNSQRELVVDGVTGILAANAWEAGEAILTLCQNAPLRQQMGEAGRARITAAPFGLTSVTAQFAAEIQRALGEPSLLPALPSLAEITAYLQHYPAALPPRALPLSPLCPPPERRKRVAELALVRAGWKALRRLV